MPPFRRTAMLIAVALMIIACGDERPADDLEETTSASEASSDNVVAVTALDYAFGVPEEIASGWVTFQVINRGKEPHVAFLYDLPDGVTWESWVEANEQWEETGEDPEWWSDVRVVGGPGFLSAGRTGLTTMHLEPGVYVMGCGVKTAEGEPHWALGMERPITVTREHGGAAEPETDLEITPFGSELRIRGEPTRGRQTIQVTFADTLIHDLHLVRLREGQSVEDAARWLEEIRAPSPYEFLGGVEQMDSLDPAQPPPTGVQYFTVDLKPGRYAWVNQDQAAKGAFHEFTIE